MNIGLIVHTVIYNDKHEVLILKRARVNDVLPEYWDIPGGTLEEGEDPFDGAIREAKEETGLDIQKPQLFFQKSNIDSGKNKQFVTLVFLAKHSGSEVVFNPDEHEEYKWITIDGISKYKTVDYLVECLKIFKSCNHMKFDFDKE